MILDPTPENILRAAQAILGGRLIGLPTETVYGIAVDAFQPAAVEAVFRLKGRPAENPLIVHLANEADLDSVAAAIPPAARVLAAAFWPGPLTLVLPKRADVPDVVTAGLSTVAVRIPSHPVAREVIQAAGTALAAPSANRFMGLSPTSAADIAGEIVTGLELVLDGGSCDVGIESTVLDLSGDGPRLLRPGVVSVAAIEELIGPVDIHAVRANERRSPGLYARHYAPKARVRLVTTANPDSAALVFGEPAGPRQFQMPMDQTAYAAALYRVLNLLDRLGESEIEVERPPKDWTAVWDRLSKASAKPEDS